MTRLLDPQKSDATTGYQPSIFEYDGSSSSGGMKRSRRSSSASTSTTGSSSSLDYKFMGNEDPTKYVIPPPPQHYRRGTTTREGGTDDHSLPRKVKTRARGSSGIPPPEVVAQQQHSWTLEELQNLDEETLVRVLYENPQLTAEVDRLRRSSGTTMDTKMSSSSKRGMTMDRNKRQRSAAGTLDKTSYLEEMRKDGIPVVQWTILLVLLGALLYQLYKALQGPAAKKTSSNYSSKKNTTAAASSSKKNKSRSTKVLDSELERLAQEVGPSVQSKTVTSVKKKMTKKKGSSSKPKSSNATTSINRSGSSKTEKPKKVEPFDPTVPALASETFHEGATATDQEGWKVVGATGSKPNEKKKTSTPTKETNVANTNTAVATVENTNNAPAAAVVTPDANGKRVAKENPASSPTETVLQPQVEPPAVSPTNETKKESILVQDDGFTQTTGKKKKKKKKTAENKEASSDTIVPTTTTTADDEALAEKLQLEEQNLAAASGKAANTKEDVWEEVVIKKRRPKA